MFWLAACSLSDGDTPYASMADEGDGGDSGADTADDTAEDTDTGQDTAEDTDTAEPVVDEPPAEWVDPTYWTDPGPLDPLLLPTVLPEEPHWQLRIATSADGLNWAPDDRVIAIGTWGFGALVVDDRLLVTTNVDAATAAERGVVVADGILYVLSTSDLTTWTTRAWSISEASVTDAALFFDLAGNVRAVWDGSDAIRTASWTGETFDDDGGSYVADDVGEPAVCRAGGQMVMFLTNREETIATVNAGTDEDWELREDRGWDGAVSPACYEQSDAIVLSAMVSASIASRAVLADGSMSAAVPVVSADLFGDVCVGADIVPFGEGWLLVCSVWTE